MYAQATIAVSGRISFCNPVAFIDTYTFEYNIKNPESRNPRDAVVINNDALQQ